MPTRPVESTHDHAEDPAREPSTAAVESPSADQMQGASGLPRDTNADDVSYGDQDIDTAGTAHDDLSPTKSM